MDLGYDTKSVMYCRTITGFWNSASSSVKWGDSPHRIPTSPVNKMRHHSIRNSLAATGKQEGTDLMCLPFPDAA